MSGCDNEDYQHGIEKELLVVKTFTFQVTFQVVQKYTVDIEAEDANEAESKIDRMPFNLLFAIANRMDEEPEEIDIIGAIEREGD